MSKGTRVPLVEAQILADGFLDQQGHLFERSLVCGSVRRKRETVGDLDIVVIPRDFKEYEATFPKNKSAYSKLQIQLQPTIDLFWGAATLYRTGSQEFNIFMRSIAKAKGLKLNEKGLWSGDTRICDAMEEEDIFKALGIPYVEPERRSRESHGEW